MGPLIPKIASWISWPALTSRPTTTWFGAFQPLMTDSLAPGPLPSVNPRIRFLGCVRSGWQNPNRGRRLSRPFLYAGYPRRLGPVSELRRIDWKSANDRARFEHGSSLHALIAVGVVRLLSNSLHLTNAPSCPENSAKLACGICFLHGIGKSAEEGQNASVAFDELEAGE